MLGALLLGAITKLINGITSLLPQWTPITGPGGQDGGAIGAFLQWIAPVNKFLPITDGFLPIFALSLLLLAAFLIVKFAKWLISLIPTIGGGG